MGIPREKIPWAPLVDREVCIGCGDCVETCPNGVFVLDERQNTVAVAKPENCVVLCDKCAGFCPQHAISFPDKAQLKQRLRQLVHERSEPRTVQSHEG